MKPNLVILKPASGSACPFYIQALQYIPDNSFADGFTLIFLHAVNLHKETFQVMFLELLKQTVSVRIRDIWCIENPNHGESAQMNHALLSTPEYCGKWTAAEYSRAVHAFLTSTSHGFDFASRMLVGVAHSGAAASLLLMQDHAPLVVFRALIFLDPAILSPNKASSRMLSDLFGNWAKSKRHTWDNRAVAFAQLSNSAFKQWDPVAVQLFVEHALRCTGRSSFTLACSPVQEAAFYLSPTADLIGRPFEIFAQLASTDELSMHLIVCLQDEYKGKTAEMKQTQIAHLSQMTRSSVQVIDGGHMFPQTRPKLCARSILQVLEKLPVLRAQL